MINCKTAKATDPVSRCKSTEAQPPGSVARVQGYNRSLSEFTRSQQFSINELENKINNLEINPCYALAGYSDKKSLKVQAESISPKQ